MPASRADWAEVGEMLQDRRVELDMRYVNLRLFAAEQGINYRLAWDAEHGRRGNYGRPARTQIELAYGLKRGSFLAAVNGGELAPAPGAPPTTRRVKRALDAMTQDAREQDQQDGGGSSGTP